MKTNKFPKQVMEMILRCRSKGDDAEHIASYLNSSKFCMSKGLIYTRGSIITKLGNMKRTSFGEVPRYRFS
jgi:hypothetical protein